MLSWGLFADIPEGAMGDHIWISLRLHIIGNIWDTTQQIYINIYLDIFCAELLQGL